MFDRNAVYNLIAVDQSSLAGGEGENFQGQTGRNTKTPSTEEERGRIEAIYARVSTRKQLEYLETQIQGLKTKYPSSIVFRDCASGLNFRRKGLLSLLQRVLKGHVRVVHLAYRDRLCRFAYDLVERIFKHHNTAITVESHDASSPESELAEDVLSIITVFSARMYGRRSGAARSSGVGCC
jgi:predicted site-specific integrase-resolvase